MSEAESDGTVSNSAEELAFDRVALTGTPGTGKTSVAERVAERLGIEVIHLNDRIREEELYTGRDEERDSLIADIDAVREHLGDWSGLVDSHLAHQLDAEAVIVLRCAPDELTERLENRGEPPEKAAENAESEALDIVLSEAVRKHGEGVVYEIDTTGRTVEDVADDVVAVLRGEREPAAGIVDFTGAL
ncbi:MAG: adenylate kinase family protein [Halolamina sp.]